MAKLLYGFAALMAKWLREATINLYRFALLWTIDCGLEKTTNF